MQMKTQKSLVHRHSARFVVRQDYPRDCKRLFSSPLRNISDKSSNYDEDAATHSKSDDASLQVMEIEPVKKTSGQVQIRA